jgi:Na+/phosphate symporter
MAPEVRLKKISDILARGVVNLIDAQKAEREQRSISLAERGRKEAMRQQTDDSATLSSPNSFKTDEAKKSRLCRGGILRAVTGSDEAIRKLDSN